MKNRNLVIVLLGLFFILLAVNDALAALPPVNEIIKYGKVIGGEAGQGFSLLKVSVLPRPGNGERWVLDIGNHQGSVNKGKPGYYHVEMNQDLRKLSIDLAQLRLNKMSDLQLKQVVTKSNFLTSPILVKDPSDQSMNLSFRLKKNIKVKVFQVAGVKGTSRIVLDLFE